MDRSWVPAVAIAGGAIVLVGAVVLLGGGSSSSTVDSGAPVTAPIAVADAAPVVTFDAALPKAIATAPAPGTTTSPNAPAPTAAPPPTSEEPVAEGPAAAIRQRMGQLKREIAQLESEGKHDEAAQKQLLLKRMQAKLDVVQNGM